MTIPFYTEAESVPAFRTCKRNHIISAGSEPGSHAFMDIWRLPREPDTQQPAAGYSTYEKERLIMLMPSIFGENLLDDWMRFPFGGYSENSLMKTDIRESDGSYEMDIDMPGFQKEDIKAELKEGYLTISASTKKNNDEKDENGKYIRRERYMGSCSRSFYVGSDVKQEDIKAKFENGILKLTVPRQEALPKTEENKCIAIEG
jgi:HSP20 family protein